VRDAFVGGPFPAAWRFECIHIFKLGEPTPSGQPPFQATVLNRLWQTDVTDHRLNILIGIESFDPATSKAQVFIGSGIGVDDASQCREPTTDGTQFEAPLVLDTANHTAQHDPAQSAISCVIDAPAGTEAYGTVNVEVPSTDAIYIYAQNAKEIPFNCTPGSRPAAGRATALRQRGRDADEGHRRDLRRADGVSHQGGHQPALFVHRRLPGHGQERRRRRRRVLRGLPAGRGAADGPAQWPDLVAGLHRQDERRRGL
jgi:hypothetical protein